MKLTLVTTKEHSGKVLKNLEEYFTNLGVELIPYQRGISDHATSFHSSVWIVVNDDYNKDDFAKFVEKEIQ